LRISKLRRLAAGTVVSCVCVLAGAEAASAVPAVWNPAPLGNYTTQVTVNGPVTFKVGTSPTPQTTITCQPGSSWGGGDAFNSGSPLTGYLTGISFANICYDGAGYVVPVYLSPGGSYNKVVQGERNGTTYSLRGTTSRDIVINSVLGQIKSAPGQAISYTGLWTNGTPSTVAFNNSPWGKVTSGPLLGQIITVTGSFSYKTNTGGWMTLV
jgi:hypothetical protein